MIMADTVSPIKNLYDTDFAAWAFEQAELLKSGKLNQLDLENLAEEIESMGRNDHRALGSHTTVLIHHLLKWQFQPERRGNSWRLTIGTQRTAINKLLKESPSLKADLNNPEWLQKAWKEGAHRAKKETDLHYDFPVCPVWTVDEILDDDFYPLSEQELSQQKSRSDDNDIER